MQSIQNVRAGSSLTATLTSQAPAVGQLTTLSGSGASQTVTIPGSLYYSPTSVATGGVAFDGLTTGSTAVTVTIPNFAGRHLHRECHGHPVGGHRPACTLMQST